MMRRLTLSVVTVAAVACATGERAELPCGAAAPTKRLAALPRDVPLFDHLGTLVGTVSDAATGQALAGAAVLLAPHSQDSRGAAPTTAPTDSAGGFVVVGAGTGALTTRAAGYVSVTHAVTLSAERLDTLHVVLHAEGCAAGSRASREDRLPTDAGATARAPGWAVNPGGLRAGSRNLRPE